MENVVKDPNNLKEHGDEVRVITTEAVVHADSIELLEESSDETASYFLG